MLTDGVYKVNFNPFFSHSYSSKKECQKLGRKATLDSFLGVCNPSFSLPRNTSLHFLLPSQCVCFMKTEAPHEVVAMENLFQVKNSHYGKVACNLSADMQQLPCRAPNSCSLHLNATQLCQTRKGSVLWAVCLAVYQRCVHNIQFEVEAHSKCSYVEATSNRNLLAMFCSMLSFFLCGFLIWWSFSTQEELVKF